MLKVTVLLLLLQVALVQGGYCNWSNCNGVVQGGDWCNASEERCISCGNNPRWCTDDPQGPTPTSAPPAPTPSGPTPSNSGTATTTRYWDCSGGACGCAYLPAGLDHSTPKPAHCYSNALFTAPAGNPYGATFYGAAAVSQALGGGDWLAEGCGKCWKVTGESNTGQTGVSTTLVLKATNYCPPQNSVCANGNAHFDIAAPGFDFAGSSLSNSCDTVEAQELTGFEACGTWPSQSSCDCSLFNNDVLETGCNNFLSLNWDNPTVAYEEVNCPTELTQLPCWAENGNGYPAPGDIPEFCADPFGSSGSPTPTNPTNPPTKAPTDPPTTRPTDAPTTSPMDRPTGSSTDPPPTSSPTDRLTSSPTDPPLPTSSPTDRPTVSPTDPTGSGNFCCSYNFKTCPGDTHCDASQDNCENGCSGAWIDPNAQDCIEKWGACTGKIGQDVCCGSSSCQGGIFYAQCK